MAAAAAFIVLMLVVYPLTRTSPSYAFAQTLDATRTVQSIHLITTPPTFGSVEEVWAEFQDAQLVRLRMNFPDTEDGPKDVVWENEQAQVWFKKKNGVATVRAPDMLKKLRVSYDFFDPARIVEGLYQMAEQGAPVDIKEPAQPGEPIVVTVKKNDGFSEVYSIDSDTKLLLRRDSYRNDQLVTSTEYVDYNQVDPAVFTLGAPADVMHIDLTQGVGLEQGALTDEEIATRVVREFFEALIAKDYAKASPLFCGIPAGKLQQDFAAIDFRRIISVGPPEPHQQTGSLRVPCKVEFEKDGKVAIFEPHGPFVRQGDSLPGYWTIIGGI
jgi:hypothetical protein